MALTSLYQAVEKARSALGQAMVLLDEVNGGIAEATLPNLEPGIDEALENAYDEIQALRAEMGFDPLGGNDGGGGADPR